MIGSEQTPTNDLLAKYNNEYTKDFQAVSNSEKPPRYQHSFWFYLVWSFVVGLIVLGNFLLYIFNSRPGAIPVANEWDNPLSKEELHRIATNILTLLFAIGGVGTNAALDTFTTRFIADVGTGIFGFKSALVFSLFSLGASASVPIVVNNGHLKKIFLQLLGVLISYTIVLFGSYKFAKRRADNHALQNPIVKKHCAIVEQLKGRLSAVITEETGLINLLAKLKNLAEQQKSAEQDQNIVLSLLDYLAEQEPFVPQLRIPKLYKDIIGKILFCIITAIAAFVWFPFTFDSLFSSYTFGTILTSWTLGYTSWTAKVIEYCSIVVGILISVIFTALAVGPYLYTSTRIAAPASSGDITALIAQKNSTHSLARKISPIGYGFSLFVLALFVIFSVATTFASGQRLLIAARVGDLPILAQQIIAGVCYSLWQIGVFNFNFVLSMKAPQTAVEEGNLLFRSNQSEVSRQIYVVKLLEEILNKLGDPTLDLNQIKATGLKDKFPELSNQDEEKDEEQGEQQGEEQNEEESESLLGNEKSRENKGWCLGLFGCGDKNDDKDSPWGFSRSSQLINRESKSKMGSSHSAHSVHDLDDEETGIATSTPPSQSQKRKWFKC